MSSRKIGRVAKVKALARRGGTPGERSAAEAALVRIGDGAQLPRAAPPRTTHLTDVIIRRIAPAR